MEMERAKVRRLARDHRAILPMVTDFITVHESKAYSDENVFEATAGVFKKPFQRHMNYKEAINYLDDLSEERLKNLIKEMNVREERLKRSKNGGLTASQLIRRVFNKVVHISGLSHRI